MYSCVNSAPSPFCNTTRLKSDLKVLFELIKLVTLTYNRTDGLVSDFRKVLRSGYEIVDYLSQKVGFYKVLSISIPFT